MYDSNAQGSRSGLVAYRINPDAGNGNAQGPPDELYVYRPGGSLNNNGNLNPSETVELLFSIENISPIPTLKTSIIRSPPKAPPNIPKTSALAIFLVINDMRAKVIIGFVVVAKTAPFPGSP